MSKTALVTGGNAGLGLAVVDRFLENGYRVLVVDRNISNLKTPPYNEVRAIEFDLSGVEDIPTLIKELGDIDILVNNAGIMNSIPYDDYPEERRNLLMKIDIEAPVALIREVTPAMIANGHGRIVNLASIAGQVGHPDIWYGIAKAGVINMTKSFAKLLGPKGIVINSVAPGPAETDLLQTIPEQRRTEIKNAVYTGRFAKPEEVASTVFWLATSCPEYINGTCIDINNGAFPR
ncbi:MAG: SDR family oxidoreductase [Bacteroidota bacterium]